MIVKCPECFGENTRKSGFAITRDGPKQQYRCKDCGRIWREKNGE